jgi:single-strand selective monofunctional uracil DNA glycosylase
MDLFQTTDAFCEELRSLRFGPPVSHVYNPLEYARRPYDLYLRRYASPPKEVVFLGMNPGPWGMAQTGVPFGEVELVRSWLGIEEAIGGPCAEHPRRKVLGFDCRRSEVSGRRFWGWARAEFGTPESFFRRFFVANYCPLLFLEESGRNLTPDRLPPRERKPLVEVCDRALRRTVAFLRPRYVIGVGRFAEERAKSALGDLPLEIARITHPSPASPLANRCWDERVRAELGGILGPEAFARAGGHASAPGS